MYRIRNSDWSLDQDHDPDGEDQKQAALRYIMEAWHLAIHDGIEPEMAAALPLATLAVLFGAPAPTEEKSIRRIVAYQLRYHYRVTHSFCVLVTLPIG